MKTHYTKQNPERGENRTQPSPTFRENQGGAEARRILAAAWNERAAVRHEADRLQVKINRLDKRIAELNVVIANIEAQGVRL